MRIGTLLSSFFFILYFLNTISIERPDDSFFVEKRTVFFSTFLRGWIICCVKEKRGQNIEASQYYKKYFFSQRSHFKRTQCKLSVFE